MTSWLESSTASIITKTVNTGELLQYDLGKKREREHLHDWYGNDYDSTKDNDESEDPYRNDIINRSYYNVDMIQVVIKYKEIKLLFSIEYNYYSNEWILRCWKLRLKLTRIFHIYF